MNDINLFFKNKKGNIQYNSTCMQCKYKCKQSFRSSIVSCRLTQENKKKGKK